MPRGGVLLDDVGPGDVRRHQFRRELNALEREASVCADRADHERFRRAGQSRDQAMSADKQRNQNLIEHFFLSTITCRLGENIVAQFGNRSMRFFFNSAESDRVVQWEPSLFPRFIPSWQSIAQLDPDSAELKKRIERFQNAVPTIVPRQSGKSIVGTGRSARSGSDFAVCRRHCLITGLPGTAKTLMVRTIAQTLGLAFKRIQFQRRT